MKIANTLDQLGSFEKAKRMRMNALRELHNIKNVNRKSDELFRVAKSFQAQGCLFMIHNHLFTVSFSDLFYEEFLTKYQENLNEEQHVRYSFLYSPFSHQLAQSSALHFLNLHLKSGNQKHVQAIIKHCPQLDLDFLLPQM